MMSSTSEVVELGTSMSAEAIQIARRLGADRARPAAQQLAEAVSLFAPLGWAMCERWHVRGTFQILDLAAQGAPGSELDEALAEMWNTDNETWLRLAAAPIRAW